MSFSSANLDKTTVVTVSRVLAAELDSVAKNDVDEKTTIEKFDCDGDDSSDDEESSRLVSGYKLQDSWQRFKQKNGSVVEKKEVPTDALFSFVLHAEGLKQLYSLAVNTQYKLDKKQLLKNDNYDQTLLLVKQSISQACLETVLTILNEFLMSRDGQLLLEDEKNDIIKRIRGLIEKPIELISQQMVIKLRKHIILQSNCGMDGLLTAIKSQMELQLNQVLTMLCGAVDVPTLGLTFRAPLEFTEANINNNWNSLLKLRDLAYEKALSILKDFKIESSMRCSPAKELIRQVGSNHYVNLQDKVKVLISQGSGNAFVRTPLNDHKTELGKEYLRDIIRYNREGHDAWTWGMTKEVSGLRHFLIINAGRLKEYIGFLYTQNFRLGLAKSCQQFFRKTLNSSHTFANINPNTFFSNLRVANRSQRRAMKNYSSCVISSGLVNKTTISVVHREWKFICGQALEQQMLTNAMSRQDEVTSLGNYDSIGVAIGKIKDIFKKYKTKITDADIAKAIRSVFKGELPDIVQNKSLTRLEKEIISNLLGGLTYLFFGCEAVRNPAIIIINQMMLDLIINEQFTWDRMLVGKKMMPMAPKCATAVARQVNDDFRSYMPYPYIYHGTTSVPTEKAEEERKKLASGEKISKKEHLIKLEAAIVKHWLVWKKIPIPKTAAECIAILQKTIQQNLLLWFGAAVSKQSDQSQSEANLAAKLAIANAGGDDTNLAEHGGNRAYLYSVTDIIVLLQNVREENLSYKDDKNESYPVKGEEKFAVTRENKVGILITNPYHKDNFFGSLNDDIKSVIGTHEVAKKNNRWRAMPRLVIIPVLSGGHWYNIMTSISYATCEVKIMWDNPFGHLPEDAVLFAELRAHVMLVARDLIRLQNNNPQFEFAYGKVSYAYKQGDQQGYGKNSYDCGPIILSNIRDYVKENYFDEKFSVEKSKHTLLLVDKPGHENQMQFIRENDRRVFSRGVQAAPQQVALNAVEKNKFKP